MRLISSFVLIAILLVVSSCGGEEKVNTRTLAPVKFESPNNNATVRLGQEFTIDISISDVPNIENLKIFTKDVEIYEDKPIQESLSLNVNVDDWKVGSVQISLEATMKDGKTRKESRIIKVLPNSFPTEYTAEAIRTYPHLTHLYTQGLEFDGDQLYEGTGSGNADRQSLLAKIDLETGEIQQQVLLDKKYFGEGITIFGDELFQLTWQEHTCIVYDKNTLEEKRTMTYSGEGWGMCNDGEYIITTDGTERIYFRDPSTFGIKRSIEVYTNQGPVKGINELEYINGKIYANVYTTNQILIIDPETGVVSGRVDCSLLALDYRKEGEVFNGIAYKESTKQLMVTGKNWPYLIEIALVEE